MNGVSGTTRKILKALSITWTLLVHCNTGDTSVNVTTLKGLNVTDQGQWTPLVLGNSQDTDIGRTSYPPNDQHSHGHKNGQPTLDTATSETNALFDGEKVSVVSNPDEDVSFISQYSLCDPKKEAMLISMCPDTAKEVEKTMCQSDEVPPTVDAIFPVTDSVSGYHFRNFYCWKCFNQSGEPLKWSGELAFTFENKPDNFSSLESFLRFIDDNPAFATWKPPGQFSYPRCEDVDLFNCTVCVPKKTKISGCSLVGRPQHRGPEKSRHSLCYVCTSYEAESSLNDTRLCENIHPEEVTYVSNWLTFFFLNRKRSNTLMIERIPGKPFSLEPWASQKCSVDLGTCSATACIDNTLLLNGKCDNVARWFLYRLALCQFQEEGDDCLRQRSLNFLDKQLGNVGTQPVNTTALDIYYEERLITMDHQNDSCPYRTDNDLELNCSDSPTLKDTITTPIKQLISFQDQTKYFTHLGANITERNDFDSLDIEISGWVRMIQVNPLLLLHRRLHSILVQILTKTGVRGNYSFCESVAFSSSIAESPPTCQVRTFCPGETQEGFKREHKPLTADSHKANNPGIIAFLGIALALMILY